MTKETTREARRIADLETTLAGVTNNYKLEIIHLREQLAKEIAARNELEIKYKLEIIAAKQGLLEQLQARLAASVSLTQAIDKLEGLINEAMISQTTQIPKTKGVSWRRAITAIVTGSLSHHRLYPGCPPIGGAR